MIQEWIYKEEHILVTMYASINTGNLFIDVRSQVLLVSCTKLLQDATSIIFSDYSFMVD